MGTALNISQLESKQTVYKLHPDNLDLVARVAARLPGAEIHFVPHPSADVRAVDMTGGGDHWQVSIKAEEFKGKSLVEQHQRADGSVAIPEALRPYLMGQSSIPFLQPNQRVSFAK